MKKWTIGLLAALCLMLPLTACAQAHYVQFNTMQDLYLSAEVELDGTTVTLRGFAEADERLLQNTFKDAAKYGSLQIDLTGGGAQKVEQMRMSIEAIQSILAATTSSDTVIEFIFSNGTVSTDGRALWPIGLQAFMIAPVKTTRALLRSSGDKPLWDQMIDRGGQLDASSDPLLLSFCVDTIAADELGAAQRDAVAGDDVLSGFSVRIDMDGKPITDLGDGAFVVRAKLPLGAAHDAAQVNMLRIGEDGRVMRVPAKVSGGEIEFTVSELGDFAAIHGEHMAASSEALPKTGDESRAMAWLALALASGAGVLWMRRRRAA